GEYVGGSRQGIRNRGASAIESGGVQQIALVQYDEIGAGDLIIEYFLDRIVMRERTIGGALPLKRLEVGGNSAVGKGGAIDNDDHAIDSDAMLDRGPMKRLIQRVLQSEARSFADNVLNSVLVQTGV